MLFQIISVIALFGPRSGWAVEPCAVTVFQGDASLDETLPNKVVDLNAGLCTANQIDFSTDISHVTIPDGASLAISKKSASILGQSQTGVNGNVNSALFIM